MATNARTKGWLAATGVALLVAALAVPALAGTASAASTLSAAGTTPSSSQQWAYGGQGWSNGTETLGNATATWNASFGWSVVFTATNTSNTTVQLEEQRTVGVSVDVAYAGPHASAQYRLHAYEQDTAFANVTDAATVLVNGSAVPALGIDNASAAANASLVQSLVAQVGTSAYSEYVNVSGSAQASIQFAPALGLIPLNLTGVHSWTSSSVATPSAAWSIAYSWSAHVPNGTAGHSGVANGSWMAMGPVTLTGYQVHVTPPFHDHKSRTAIVLIVQGGADLYDGFILVPHGFDLFGGAAAPAVGVPMGGATIASGETLFLTPGPVSVTSLTAAEASFGTTTVGAPGMGPTGGLVPAASGSPSPSNSSVLAQPESVQAAQNEANCLVSGCGAGAAAGLGGMLVIVLVAAAVVVVVGTVGVVEWRSYARRKSQKGLVGGYGEGWPNGVPPAAASTFSEAPVAPSGAPAAPEEPQSKL